MESLILSIRIERRWPLWALLGVAVVWLVLAAMAAVGAGLAALLLAVLPPVALGLIAAALLPGAGQTLALTEAEARLEDARFMLREVQERLVTVDAGLASSIERTTALAGLAATALPGLGGSAAALEAAAARVVGTTEATRILVDGFGAALPALARTVAEVDATLRAVGADSAVQLRAVETTLGHVQERARVAAVMADASIAEMTALLARIDEASARNTTALSKRAYALDAAIDGVLERTAAAVDHMREQVEGRMAALEAGVGTAGRQLTILGDDSVRLFNQRLEMLLATSERLQGHFAEHEAGSERLQAVVAGHVDGLRDRLAGMGADGAAVVDGLAERVAAVEAQAAGLGEALGGSAAAVAGLEAQADALGNKVVDVEDVLNERLAAVHAALAGLESEVQRVFGEVAGLGKAVDDGSVLVGDAAAALAQEREELERSAAALAGHFEAARTAIGAITGDSAAAGDEAAAAFAAPVRAQIAEIETATARAANVGKDAATRLAGHMTQLAETVDAVEARMGAVETRFAVRERDSLSGLSMRLIAQLQTAAVDVARLMTIKVGEDAWAAYLRGDRSVFAGAIAAGIEAETVRQMARLLAQDAGFASDAVRYCEIFEALIARLLGDADGEAMAAVMLSADLGKIYTVIAAAAGRTPPGR